MENIKRNWCYVMEEIGKEFDKQKEEYDKISEEINRWGKRPMKHFNLGERSRKAAKRV